MLGAARDDGKPKLQQQSAMPTASSASSRERRRLLLDVLLPVAALILLGAAVNVFLINRAGATLDDEAGRTQKQIVSSMAKRLLIKLDRFVGDFALWDEFYAHSVAETYPVEWSDANLGPYIADAFDASGAWVITEDERLIYSWTEDPSKDSDAVYQSGPDLKRLAQAAATCRIAKARPTPCRPISSRTARCISPRQP